MRLCAGAAGDGRRPPLHHQQQASYAAAATRVRVNEALAGLSQDLSDLGLTLAETEAQTADLQARAAAIDDVMQARVLAGAAGDAATAPVSADDAQIQVQIEVEAELAALKQRLRSAG